MKQFSCVMLILIIVEGIKSSEKDETVVILSSSHVSESNYIVKNVGEDLELTCSSNKNQSVGWMLPKHLRGRALYSQEVNGASKLTITHLLEIDTGDYVCGLPDEQHEAIPCSVNGLCTNHSYSSSETVHLYVKKRKCLGFQCTPTVCIPERYICDGQYDCFNNEDESPDLCGLDPCLNKIRCNGRCIPQEWCCLHEDNCTRKWDIGCCPEIGSGVHGSKIMRYLGSPQHYNDHFSKNFNNSNIVISQQDPSDFNLLQTLVHTVIGCALVLVVVSPILVIGVCRLYLRHRSYQSCRESATSMFYGPRTFPRRSTHFTSVAYHPSPRIEGAPTDGFNSFPLSEEETTEQANDGGIFYNHSGHFQSDGPPPYYEAIYFHNVDDPPPSYASANNSSVIEEQASSKTVNV